MNPCSVRRERGVLLTSLLLRLSSAWLKPFSAQSEVNALREVNIKDLLTLHVRSCESRTCLGRNTAV